MEKVKRILKFGMRMEKDAKKFYDFYKDKAVSEGTKKLFTQLSDIENQHYNYLKKKLDDLCITEPPITMSWVVDNDSKEEDPHILSTDANVLQEFKDDPTEIAIIRMAYLIETDFAYFYTRASDSVDEPDIKKFLSEMAAWETQHSDMFNKIYKSLLGHYWDDISSLLL